MTFIFSLIACGSNETPQSADPSSTVVSTANVNSFPIDHSGPEESAETIGSHILIAYFTWADNTGDLFSIVAAERYPSDYDQCLERAADEKADNARPQLTESVSHMDDYDVIFLGYPDWWHTCPMPVLSLLDSYNFSGKTIIPFCAHGTSNLANSVQEIQSGLPEDANIVGSDWCTKTGHGYADHHCGNHCQRLAD